MTPISVIVIDDNDNYRVILKALLDHAGIDVMGDFSHKSFIQCKPDLMPHIAIISFWTSLAFTLPTVGLVRQNHPSVKIVLCASAYDNVPISDIQKMDIDALIIKGLDAEVILNILEIVQNGGKYFGSQSC